MYIYGLYILYIYYDNINFHNMMLDNFTACYTWYCHYYIHYKAVKRKHIIFYDFTIQIFFFFPLYSEKYFHHILITIKILLISFSNSYSNIPNYTNINHILKLLKNINKPLYNIPKQFTKNVIN